ncbi:hypothetical protein GCM10023349_35240 [Nocardioides conyzicola]|uniref:Uncharacterized protein n=1 Tax=Nocardioides conyzicola TaxID=1651781 RepID=A0ABP8XR76_9ACTN
MAPEKARHVEYTMKSEKTVKVTAGVSHQRSARRVLTPMRALVGPFTPVEPAAVSRASVDAIATSGGSGAR